MLPAIKRTFRRINSEWKKRVLNMYALDYRALKYMK